MDQSGPAVTKTIYYNDSLRLRQRHRLSSVCPLAWWPSSLAACVYDASCFQITLALLRSPLLLFRLRLPKQCFSTSFHLQPCTTECTKCKITKETLLQLYERSIMTLQIKPLQIKCEYLGTIFCHTLLLSTFRFSAV